MGKNKKVSEKREDVIRKEMEECLIQCEQRCIDSNINIEECIKLCREKCMERAMEHDMMMDDY
jgi:hypothetical protein